MAHIDLVTADGVRLEAQVSREQGRTLSVGVAVQASARVAHVFGA